MALALLVHLTFRKAPDDPVVEEPWLTESAVRHMLQNGILFVTIVVVTGFWMMIRELGIQRPYELSDADLSQ